MSAVLSFSSDADREVAALISALYALGRADAIQGFLSELFSAIDSPAAQLASWSPKTLWQRFPKRPYRFFSPIRSFALLCGIGHALRTHGTLEDAALANRRFEQTGSVPSQPQTESLGHPQRVHDSRRKSCASIDMLQCLRRAISQGIEIHYAELCKISEVEGQGDNPLPGIIFPAISSDRPGASAAKRLMLFLRWMVRNDELDLGLWKSLTPQDLIIPLDTHMMHISAILGLRNRKSADLTTALEITEGFRRINPEDPVKYDFCLTRLGIRPDLSKDQLDISLFR